MICSVLGHPTPHSVCACICAYMAVQEMGWRLQLLLSDPLEEPQPFLGSAWALWLERSGLSGSPAVPLLACSGLSRFHQQERGWSSLSPSPSEPLSTCAFTPSACKGRICHRKMITSTFFFCILINTEEAGAVKLYLGENFRTGLFGVVEPLTAFRTQLVIKCFVYLFSVFISTNKHCNYSY